MIDYIFAITYPIFFIVVGAVLFYMWFVCMWFDI
jgi:hypothetical protein